LLAIWQIIFSLIATPFEKKFSIINIEGLFSKADLGIVPQGNVRSEVSYFYALDKFFYLTFLQRKFNGFKEKNTKLRGIFTFSIAGKGTKPLLVKLYNRWLNLYNTFYG
jgi:hypothetical protein